MREFRVGDINMLVSKNTKICVTPNMNAKICVNPESNPQCKPAEYRSRWVPNANFSGHADFFFYVNFIHVVSRFSVEYGLTSFKTALARRL